MDDNIERFLQKQITQFSANYNYIFKMRLRLKWANQISANNFTWIVSQSNFRRCPVQSGRIVFHRILFLVAINGLQRRHVTRSNASRRFRFRRWRWRRKSERLESFLNIRRRLCDAQKLCDVFILRFFLFVFVAIIKFLFVVANVGVEGHRLLLETSRFFVAQKVDGRHKFVAVDSFQSHFCFFARSSTGCVSGENVGAGFY